MGDHRRSSAIIGDYRRSTFRIVNFFSTAHGLIMADAKSQQFHCENRASAMMGLSRVSQKIVPRLCGFCGGAVDSIISVFTQLHRSSFNLEFETLFESI